MSIVLVVLFFFYGSRIPSGPGEGGEESRLKDTGEKYRFRYIRGPPVGAYLYTANTVYLTALYGVGIPAAYRPSVRTLYCVRRPDL